MILYKKIIEYYEPKYNAFVKQFGDIKAKVLPGNAFYDLYEEFKRKNRVQW